MRQADLQDSVVLEKLLDVLDRLARPLEEVVSEVEEDATPRLKRLEEALDDGRDAVRSAERALEDADEESFRSCEDRLEEARAYLRQLEDAFDEVRDAASKFRAASGDLRAMSRQELPGARSFLQERIDAVRAYASLHVHSSEREHGLVQAGLRGVDGAVTDGGLSFSPLPSGFEWIPLDRITIADESQLEFKHASKDIIEIGMRAFRRELVPALHRKGFSRDDLVDLDLAAGRSGGIVHPESLANLYDIFFGSDPIAASPTVSGTLELSSGRHRVVVARSLGWTHVPGRMLGGGQ